MPQLKYLIAPFLIACLSACATGERTQAPCVYSSGDIGAAPEYKEFFDLQRRTYPEILDAFNVSASEITGLGGLADDRGLTGEVVIPFGGPAYKVDVRGVVSTLKDTDKIIFLEAANYAPNNASFAKEVVRAVSFTPREHWKKTLENALPDRENVYLITIKSARVPFTEFKYPGPKSKFARSMPEYAPTAETKRFKNLRNASFAGFYGTDSIGFPGIHLHGIGTVGSKKVGGHLNGILGDFEVRMVPLLKDCGNDEEKKTCAVQAERL